MDLVRCEGWSRDQRREGRSRDIGPGTSSLVKVGPWAWSDVKVGSETRGVKVGPETTARRLVQRHRPRHLVNREGRPRAWSDVKVGPETRDRDSMFSTCTAYGLVTCSVFGLSYLLR